MNYVVIDLEMCKVPKMYRNKVYKYATEIIEVGTVLLDGNFKQIATLRQYVHPKHGVLDHYISDLTGIQNAQIKNAPLLAETLKHLTNWLGDREYKVFAWSECDYTQLKREIECKKIEDEQIQMFMQPERWVGYQDVFVKRNGFSRAISLSEALILCGMEPYGRLHDGLDDAVNTAKLIEMLELNPNYQIHNYEKELAISAEPLQFCMGDLFAGVKLECIA